MSLTSLNPKISYRTGRDDLVEDFFVPCLGESVLYRRAAGYFSSHGLALAARGVASLVHRQGRMRLVVSPHLEPDDVEALQAAEQNADLLRAITAKGLVELENELHRDRLNTLAWLAACGHLQVRLALRVDADGRIRRGLYHEKVGIFTDEDDQHVAFSGSSNETAGGLLENFESIEVFRSWNDPDDRVGEKIANFEALWDDTTPGLRIIEFTQASRDLLESFRDPSKPPPGFSAAILNEGPSGGGFRPPRRFELRDYQAEAIREWSKAGGRGILAMATGAGKTLTALVLASKVAEKNSPLVLIIICPFINLCRQWLREVSAFGLRPIPCFEGRQRWEALMEEEYQRLSAGLTQAIALVTTNATFQSEAFQGRLRPRVANAHHLLVADEVHNLGAEHIQQSLPDGIRLRVGLSATPERHHDPVGTQAVVDYFGGIVYEFPLARAIAEGRLCGYRYYPHLVTLTDEEANEYAEITEKLGRMLARKDRDEELGQAAMPRGVMRISEAA